LLVGRKPPTADDIDYDDCELSDMEELVDEEPFEVNSDGGSSLDGPSDMDTDVEDTDMTGSESDLRFSTDDENEDISEGSETEDENYITEDSSSEADSLDGSSSNVATSSPQHEIIDIPACPPFQ
jgi:hypothetical protein